MDRSLGKSSVISPVPLHFPHSVQTKSDCAEDSALPGNSLLTVTLQLYSLHLSCKQHEQSTNMSGGYLALVRLFLFFPGEREAMGKMKQDWVTLTVWAAGMPDRSREKEMLGLLC